jgi:hypothetical protein
MNGFKKYMAATFLSTAMLFTSLAQAMQIQQFDKMAGDDRDEYVAELIIGAQKVLNEAGKPDLAEQVHKLFTTKLPGDEISVGRTEFDRNLARLRVDDAENATGHPNDPRLEVEDAMFLTLQKNHIPLPDSFFTVASNFKPKLPPQTKDVKKKDDKKKN